jgi:lipid-binding SYLF domain-containing protein
MIKFRRKKMKFLARVLSLIVLAALISTGFADDKKDDAEKEAKYRETLAEFNKSPLVAQFIKSAYGYAVFPTIGKGGLGIGGAHGTGQVYRGGTVTGKSVMNQLTIGFQAGGQAYSQIVLFENKKAYDEFTGGGFEFGAQATAVAITASANAEVGTKGNAAGASGKGDAGAQKAEYVNGMAVFTFAKGGLMYEATLGGQKYNFESPNKEQSADKK